MKMKLVLKKNGILGMTLCIALLIVNSCQQEPKTDEEDRWPNTSGYTYFRTFSNEKLSVSPGQKYYSSGTFESFYGSSIDLKITSEQNCLITIDFSKFKFGGYSAKLNDVSCKAYEPINVNIGDTLVFQLNPGGQFSIGSNRDWMFGFSVKDGCDLGHVFLWTVIDTLYPATSAEKPCTRCDISPISGAPARITQLGDTGPGGGIIFYISTDGFDFFTGTTPADETKTTAYYLEAADKDQETKFRWCSATNGGGTPALISSVANATAIGTGKRNTALILRGDSWAPAASACSKYEGGGKNDWFLPSKDELDEFYQNCGHFDGITSGIYWSSSQFDRERAWYSGGSQSNTFKINTFTVRAIRAF